MAESTHHTETNPRLTENTCDEPEASLMPLEDYQHSDIVPLEIATETIKSFFHNLPRDVWIAKNASKKSADSLTSDESAAIHLYSMEVKEQPLYSLLNKLLRDRDRRKLKLWFPYLKLFLTALFKLSPSSTKIVWRGVKADLHSKYHRGEHYTWWTFSSCASSREVLEQPMYLGTTGTRTLFSIECLNGKNIKPHSYYQTEDEILLMPGFYFEVVSKIAAGNGLHIIHVREVIPPFVLLEPPFDIQQSSSISPTVSIIDSVLDKVYEMNKDNDDMFKLFIVLPNLLFEWNSENLFENEYVLHFVCECSINEMHFTCRPAYAVSNPRVFFQIYGEYMKQYMIPLAQHLSNHQTIEAYHDAHFWSVYKTNLDKITRVLDVIVSKSVTTTKAYDTSALRQLLMSNWSFRDSLCRSITAEMNVRWVCMDHYPSDQLSLIHELDDIENVIFDIEESSLAFIDKIDSTKTSRFCGIFARGLRLHWINLSGLKASRSSLQQITRILSQASLMNIYYYYYVSDKSSDSEKSDSDALLRSCNEIIALNPRLKYVDITDCGVCSQRNDGIVDALKSNRSLLSFSYGLKMASNDVVQLMSMFEKKQILTTLELSNHTLSSKDVQTIAIFIRSSPTLINLTLSDTKIMDEGMQIIVDAISANPIIKKLNVKGNELSDESTPLITHLLQACSSLTSLDISSNNFTVIGARLILEELQTNRTLLHFNIRYRNLLMDQARKTTNYKSSVIGVGELVARMLLENTTLYTLDISDIEVSDNDVRPLAEALMKNRTLAHLRLGESKYGFISCKQITNVLHWKCSLVGLDLSSSGLSKVDVQKLSEMLQKNDKLHFLNLRWCDIRDNGMSIIAQGLKNNRVLSHINLSDNELTSLGAKALADVLKINKNIICLDIHSNRIGDDGANAIADALIGNRTLIYIDMMSNGITDIGGQAMAQALESNGTLLHLGIIYGSKLSSSILTKLRSIRRNLKIT